MMYNIFGGDTRDYTVSVTYLELPFKVGIKTKNRRPQIFCSGLFYGYAISGRMDERKLRFGNDPEDDYRPIDFGYILGYGLELNSKCQLLLSYERGLADIDPGDLNVRSNLVPLTFSVFLSKRR